MQFIGFNTTEAQVYTATQRVARVDNCNGWVARCLGDTPVRVNGHILFPGPAGPPQRAGDSYTEGGNLGEIYLGYIDIEFVPPLGADLRVEITQKFYILDKPLNSQNLVQ